MSSNNHTNSLIKGFVVFSDFLLLNVLLLLFAHYNQDILYYHQCCPFNRPVLPVDNYSLAQYHRRGYC